MLVVDAHEDIAWNALALGRDYTRSTFHTRHQEATSAFRKRTGSATLGKPEWLLGRVGIIFATLFATPERHRVGTWDTQVYEDATEAHQIASAQLDYYHRLAETDETFRLVGTQSDLSAVLQTWAEGTSLPDHRIGLIPLMEGADPIREPEEAELWYEHGLRIIGPAWEATRYAGGSREPGPFTAEGLHLLEVMAQYGFILDLSHLAEQAYLQAIERCEGTLIASHTSPRRFLPEERGLSDTMIAMLAERGGVMGITLYNRFLKPGWQRGDRRTAITAATVADAIDHVCQITGSAAHVGIGSDLDGLFGLEHMPAGMDSVMDLITIANPLRERGYNEDDIERILSGNWLRILRQALPE